MIGINLSDFSYRGFISGREYRPFDSLAKRVSLIALSAIAAIASLLLLPPLFGITLGAGFAALAFALINGEKTPQVYTTRSIGSTIQTPLKSPSPLRHTSVRTGNRNSNDIHISPERPSTSHSIPRSHHVQVGGYTNRKPNYTPYSTNTTASREPLHVQVGGETNRNSNSTNHHSFIPDFMMQLTSGQNLQQPHVQVGEETNRSSRFSNFLHRI